MAVEAQPLPSPNALRYTPQIYDIGSSRNNAEISKEASTAQDHEDNRATPLMEPSECDLAIEAAMSLESLAWGTMHLEQRKLLPSPEILTLLEELQNLIDSRKVRNVIQFHKEHLA